jgi:hypothetical protein
VAAGEIPEEVFRDWCQDNQPQQQAALQGHKEEKQAAPIHSHSLILELYEAARALLRGEQGAVMRLTAAVKSWEQMAVQRESRFQPVIETAREMYAYAGDEEVSIDDWGMVYHNGNDGYWVEAWVFVGEERIEEFLDED